MKTLIAAAITAAITLTPTAAMAAAVEAVSDEESPYTTIYNPEGNSVLGEVAVTRVGTPVAGTYGDGKEQSDSGEWVDLPPITSFAEDAHTFTYKLTGDTDLIAGVKVTIPTYFARSDALVHQSHQGDIPAMLSANSDGTAQELSFSIPGITHYLTHSESGEMTGLGIVFDIQITDTSGRTAVFHQAYSAGNAGIAPAGTADPTLSSTAPLFTDCSVFSTTDLSLCGQWTGIRFQQLLEAPPVLPTTGAPTPTPTPTPTDPPVITPTPTPTEPPVVTPEPTPTAPVYSELVQTGGQPPYGLLVGAGVLIFAGVFLALTQQHIRRSTR